MKRTLYAVLLAGACLRPLPAPAETPLPPDPVYVAVDHGYVGIWARPAEYVEYTLTGEIKLQDAYHLLLAPGTGMMLTFADRHRMGPGKNLLETHRKWELAYWRAHAAKLESRDRSDLAAARHDLMVTEITVFGPDGSSIKAYLIAVAASDGVFVFSISPAAPELDAAVREFVASIKVEHRRLDLRAEAMRIVPESGPPESRPAPSQSTRPQPEPGAGGKP